MKLNINTFILSTLAFMGLVSCDDSLDINAPYKEVPVVYGLMNQGEQTQLVKVNKLFQTTENTYIAAQNEEDQKYNNLEAYVMEVNPNTLDTVGTYRLMDTLITDRDSGTFYYPNQTMYYFNAPINQNNLYYFEMVKEDGGKATAETKIIKSEGVNVIPLPNSWGNGVPFYNFNGVANLTISINVPVNAQSYQSKMEFRYVDVYLDGSTSDTNVVSADLGTFSLNSPVSGVTSEQVELDFSGEILYTSVANQVKDIEDDPNVAVRIVDLSNCIRFSVWLANEEFTIFRDLNEPSSSLLDDNPFYGNINGGEGLFASRAYSKTDAGMSKYSYTELSSGVELGLTGTKGFCEQYPPTYTNCYP